MSIAHRLSVSAPQHAIKQCTDLFLLYKRPLLQPTCALDLSQSNTQNCTNIYIIRILVLKDGQIIEKGNLKELLAIDGTFASMWADQVSSTDDPALLISDNSVKKELSGYIVESEEIKVENPQDTAETLAPITFPVALAAEPSSILDEEPVKLDVPSAVAADEEGPLPQSEPVDTVDIPDTAPVIPVIPVSSETSLTTPAQFPTMPEIPQPEIRRSDSPSQPAVTFDVNSPPERTGTPDLEGEPKRKRISSQNFQRLARRMSLTTRRQGSVSSILPNLPNIPGLKRSDSPRVSTDDNNARGEGSTSNDSPASSVKGDDKGKSKKDKKDKKAAI